MLIVFLQFTLLKGYEDEFDEWVVEEGEFDNIGDEAAGDEQIGVAVRNDMANKMWTDYIAYRATR
jgi:hypothetical protein